MKDLIFSIPVADAGNVAYIPVPCRGVVNAVRAACDVNMVATGTIILSRSTTAVNTVTIPTGDKAAGTVIDGVPDTTNEGLVFDPDDDTAANKVIKVTFDATILASAGNVILHIKYDDSAYVKQAPLEA